MRCMPLPPLPSPPPCHVCSTPLLPSDWLVLLVPDNLLLLASFFPQWLSQLDCLLLSSLLISLLINAHWLLSCFDLSLLPPCRMQPCDFLLPDYLNPCLASAFVINCMFAFLVVSDCLLDYFDKVLGLCYLLLATFVLDLLLWLVLVWLVLRYTLTHWLLVHSMHAWLVPFPSKSTS